MVGLATLGYGIWILVTTGNVSNFLSGSLVFTYSFLGVGLLLTIIGLLGCIGGCAESTCCLKAYIGLLTFLLIVDIGIGIAAGVMKDQVFTVTEHLWDEVNSDTKAQIQKELKCCGYSSPLDYGVGSVPSSCFGEENVATSIFQTGCQAAMETWVHDNTPIWASVLASVLFVQIASTIASCMTLKKVEDAMRVGIA
ncbi:hypothetical protein DPMN_085732 [Dreissena polymorpha]|uniref:Tetraspanin n=1 Tax=Dreissena polymorpha TaxID=45954 RepID=A0A9D4BM69_DREPO|nr:hypothetical protein DPMN_085732 [Dreissena polymorpha]